MTQGAAGADAQLEQTRSCRLRASSPCSKVALRVDIRVNIRVDIRVNIRVNFKVVGKKNPKKKFFEKNPAERSAFSESPGRETPILKI